MLWLKAKRSWWLDKDLRVPTRLEKDLKMGPTDKAPKVRDIKAMALTTNWKTLDHVLHRTKRSNHLGPDLHRNISARRLKNHQWRR